MLGADTVVALEDQILGKPRDAAQARAFLGRLAGRTHRVVSAVAVASDGVVKRSGADVTEVRFRALTSAFLDAYVATEEWQGRAGGYAIQGRGAALVASISGDYLSVVGLPVALLLDLVPELLEPGDLQPGLARPAHEPVSPGLAAGRRNRADGRGQALDSPDAGGH